MRATVNVSYDEGSEERTDEVYDPNQVATLSMQKSEQVSTGRREPSGVPGTASNSPAGAPEGAVQGSQAAAAPGTPPLLQKEALPVYPQQGAGQGRVCMKRMEPTELQNIWCIPSRGRDGCGA